MDSMIIEAWIYEMFKRIIGSNYAEISLIILNDIKVENESGKSGFFTNLFNNRKHLLYFAYCKYENRKVDLNPDAFEMKDSSKLFANVPILKVKPEQKKFSDRFLDKDIEEIEKYDIDVLYRAGFRILRGKILTVAKYGIWSYHHGDNKINRGGPAGFWEVFENHPTTGSILQILTEDLDNGIVLYRSYSSTERPFVKENRNNYYWKSISFFPRKLEELHRMGEKEFFKNEIKLEGYVYESKKSDGKTND